MCGIIAGFNTTPKGGKKKKKIESINKFIIDQYQDQCNRGQKGFGIIRILENGTIEIDRATQEMKFLLDLYIKPAKMIIAHHRQPTSTENKMNQTHPIYVSNKTLEFDYYFIHNGIISNDTKLKAKHEKLGYKYTTEYKKEGYYPQSPTTEKFNDTEALAIEVVLFIEKKQSFVETTNSAAFIVLQVNKKTKRAEKVYFGKSGSGALNLSKFQGNMKISSEGEGEDVVAETLWSFDPKDPKMKLTSIAMEFKVIEEKKEEVTSPYARHQHQLPSTTITDTKTDSATPKTENDAELIVIEERKWMTKKGDESITEYNYEEEDEIFAGKNYLEETVQDFKASLKEDDSDMIESTLDAALDDQVERIEKMMKNFQLIIQNRKVDPKERGFYLQQTFKFLKTMEAITDAAEEDYEHKIAQEEIKAEEDKLNPDPYNVNNHHMGYRASKTRAHNYRTGEYEDMTTGNIRDFNGFG